MKNKSFVFLFIFFYSFLSLQAQQWTNYTTGNSSLVNNNVTSIFIDTQGKKWFGTAAGASKFDNVSWSSYSTIYNIRTVLIDSVGTRYFGTYGNGVINDTYSVTYSTGNGLANNNVYTSVIDKNGYEWFGTANGLSKLIHFPFSWKNYFKANGLADYAVLSLATDKQGNIWAGTGNGLSKFDGTSWTTYLNGGITAIAIDKQGNKWLGTAGGVFKFDDVTWTHYTMADGLIDNAVSSIAIDTLGNKWFGTSFGVSEFDGATKWKSFSTADGLINNTVKAIAVDPQNNVWFGTNGGVSKLTIDPCLIFKASIKTSNKFTYFLGDSVLITASSGKSYKWNNGDTTQNVFVKQSGNYYVVIKSINGCIDTSNTIQVLFQNSCDSIKVGITSQPVCHVGTILNIKGAHYYTWSPPLDLSSYPVDSIVAYPDVSRVYTLIGNSGNCSDTTTITVNPPTDPLCKPPAVYQVHKALIAKSGGQSCVPDGSNGMAAFNQTLFDNYNKAVIMSFFPESIDSLYAWSAEGLREQFKVSFTPSFVVNDKVRTYFSSSIVKNIVDSTYLVPPIANSACNWEIIGDSIYIHAKTRFFSADSGIFYMGLYIIEKNVISYQNGLSDYTIHKLVLREIIGSPRIVVDIASGYIHPGSEYTQSYSYMLDNSWDKANITVAAVIWKLGSEAENYKLKFMNGSMDASFIPLNSSLVNVESYDDENTFYTYPNPSTGIFNLKMNGYDNSEKMIEVYNVLGEYVFSKTFTSQYSQLDLRKEKNGIYLLKLITEKGIVTEKIILNK